MNRVDILYALCYASSMYRTPEQMKNYAVDKQAKLRQRSHDYYHNVIKKNPELWLKMRQSIEQWRLKNPEKRKAHNIVANALKSGRMVRGKCLVCGLEKVQAHHEDYSQPYMVMWLCREHHKQADMKLKRSK